MADPQQPPVAPANQSSPPAPPPVNESEVRKLGEELTWYSIGSDSNASDLTSSEILALLGDFGSEPPQSVLNLEDYRRLERDPKVAACLQIRTAAVTHRDCVVIPGGSEEVDLRAADFVREQLLANDGRSGLLDIFTPPMLAQSLLLGYSVSELMWERNSEGQAVIGEVMVRDIDRFEFRRPEKPVKGAFLHFRHHLHFDSKDTKQRDKPLPDRKFFVFTYGSRIGNPYGLGLGIKLWYPVFYKRTIYSHWNQYAQRYADPIPYMELDQGAMRDALNRSLTQSDLDESGEEADKLIKGLRRGTSAVLPSYMRPNFLEPSRSGTTSTYKELIEVYDTAISETILGNLNAGSSQGLSGAPAGNDEHIRAEIARADGEAFQTQVNSTIVKWLTELNFPGAKPPQIWRDFTPQEPLSDRAQRDSTLLQLGYRISPEAVAKIYGPDYIDTEAESSEAQSPLAAWMSSRNTNNDTNGSLGAEGVKEEGEATTEVAAEVATEDTTEDATTGDGTDATDTEAIAPTAEGEVGTTDVTDSGSEFAEPDDFSGMTIEEMADLVSVAPAVLFAEYENGAIDALEFGVSPRDAGLRRVRRWVADRVNEV